MIDNKLLSYFWGVLFVLSTAIVFTPSSMALTSMEELGKKLFFDSNLSTPKFQACAICHLPQVGWAGPDMFINAHGAVYEGAVKGRFGNRKPPSAAYATLSPIFHYNEGDKEFVGGNFWDGRATGEVLGNPAADQALGPYLNPVEQNNPSKKVVCQKVANSQYADLWQEVFGEPIDCDSDFAVNKNYNRIGLSVAEYEDSSEVNQFSSKFDFFLKGDVDLTAQEMAGLALFNGKANCSVCHTSTPGQNNVPPLFTEFTFANLGTPKNPENPFYRMDKVRLDDGSPINPEGKRWIDPGLGGFLKTRSEWEDLAFENMGKHKVPTLRNVDLRIREGFVKAYAHNGFFKSLEGLVHFYNTRDVKGTCPDSTPDDPTDDFTEAKALDNNCWPSPEVRDNVNTELLGDLGLSESEERAIVAFLKTLSDGYRRPETGESLFESYCMGCHGSPDPVNALPAPVAPRKVIGARTCSIEGAINGTAVFRKGVRPMRFMKDSFTDGQIMMISDYLNSFNGIMGEQRFITTCAGCHGIDASGGRVDEDVKGEDAGDIMEAIKDEDPMRFLRCLPDDDIFDIGGFLRTLERDDHGHNDDRDDRDDRDSRDSRDSRDDHDDNFHSFH